MSTEMARVLPVVGVLAMLPILMGADSCKGMAPSNEARFVEPSRQGAYCNEDVPVEAVASASPTADFNVSAVLLVDTKDGYQVLKRVTVNRGDQIVLSATIPWTSLSSSRGHHIRLALDMGVFPETFAPGSILSQETFGAVFHNQTISARATRALLVCD
jgi:hypothetical protein